MLESGKTEREIMAAAGCGRSAVATQKDALKAQDAQMAQTDALKVQDAQMAQEENSLPQEESYIDCPLSDGFDAEAALNAMLNGNQSVVDEITDRKKVLEAQTSASEENSLPQEDNTEDNHYDIRTLNLISLT